MEVEELKLDTKARKEMESDVGKVFFSIQMGLLIKDNLEIMFDMGLVCLNSILFKFTEEIGFLINFQVKGKSEILQ